MERPKVEVSQASRVITAARRQAWAREMARITGSKARGPSALEPGAKAVKEGKRPILSRQEEMLPFTPSQASLPAEAVRLPEAEASWRLYNLEPEEGERIATTITRGWNMAGVGALSRRLMAIERARARAGNRWTFGLTPWSQRAGAGQKKGSWNSSLEVSQ